MCVVATYVIMHVIVYFGVCKCHGCSSHLCKWMFNLVMQACPYKCVYIYVVVLYEIPAQNTHVLLSWIISVLLCQRKQFIQVNCMPYIAHTLIWLTVSFVLPNHKQFIRVNRLLYIAHTFIWLPVSFVPPHRKQLIELNRMPCIAHATKIWTVFDASVIANVLHLFWRFLHHRLRLWHRTQFHRTVSDRSVALAASCSSEPGPMGNSHV